MKNLLTFSLFLFSLFLSFCSLANLNAEEANNIPSGSFFSGLEGNKYVKPEIIFNFDSYSPEHNELPKVGILFNIEKDWHIYWKFPGESGKPSEIKWNLPDSWKHDELLFPNPKRTIERGDINTFGYTEEVLIYTTLSPPSDIDPDKASSITVNAEVSWLVCFDRCIPGKASLSKELQISKSEPKPSSDFFHFDKAKRSIPKKLSSVSSAIKTLSEKGIEVYLANLANTLNSSSSLIFKLEKDLNSPKKISAQFFELSSILELGIPEVSENDNYFFLKIPIKDDISKDNLAFPSGVLIFEIEDSKRLNFEIPEIPLSALNKPNDNLLNELKSLSFKESNFLLYSYKEHEVDEGAISSALLIEDSSSPTSLIFILLAAFIGGIILNFMPCVLPILSIKLMGIISAKEKSTKSNLYDALWFGLGIMFSFLLLAFIASSLKAGGQTLGWGFQFQYPGFVFALILVLFILSLGFFDLYLAEIPFLNSLTKLQNKKESTFNKSSEGKHFFDGVLISALSTPCTAPFLGTALVFAFSQSSTALFLVFISIALGLFTPYLLIVSQPRLLKLFPKPGNWMNRIKQLMGFSLLATCIWLLMVLEKSAPGSAFRSTGILLALYMFFWFISWGKEQSGNILKYLLFIIGLSIPLVSWNYLHPFKKVQITENDIKWLDYDESYLNSDKAIFIDFTAEWCITCKYNKNFILSKNLISKRFKELEITALKADWSTADEKVTAALEKFKGSGVPHYVYIPKGRKDFIILPTILTESILLDNVK